MTTTYTFLFLRKQPFSFSDGLTDVFDYTPLSASYRVSPTPQIADARAMASDFFAVGGYDGMAAIVHAVQALKGKMDGDAAVAALKGWKFNSPRGPIMIDPDTRDIIMNEYLVEVVKGSDGKLHQKLLSKIDNVKDACKAQKIAPCT
jgi:hypothetical protein